MPGAAAMNAHRAPVHTQSQVPFLEDQERGAVLRNSPERPPRRVSAAQRRRRQFLARRLLGVGVLLAVLIAVVLGFKGFLDARSDRGLRHYATNVGTIMRESEQRGEDFFALLDSPAGTSP